MSNKLCIALIIVLIVVRKGKVVCRNAYRCSQCDIDWPYTSDYQTCLKCDSQCWSKKVKFGETPMSHDEAKSIKRHIEFKAYSEMRDREEVGQISKRLQSDTPLYVEDLLEQA